MNNEDERLSSAIGLLYEYLPFICDMKLKTRGTATETKWKKLHESIIKPKRKLTLEAIHVIKTGLIDLKQDVNRKVEVRRKLFVSECRANFFDDLVQTENES